MTWSFFSSRDIGRHRGAFTSTAAVSDLDLRNSGEEVCQPGHLYQGVRDHFIIHLVLSGRGTFQVAGVKSALGRGALFFIPAGVAVEYQADTRDPWHYTWVGFAGAGVGRMGKRVPLLLSGGVVHGTPSIVMKGAFGDLMNAIHHQEPGHELLALSAFYQILGLLPGASRSESPSSNHIEAADDFLRRHHAMKMDVGDISKALGLDRTYLSALYRRKTGMTLAETLENLRLERGKKLLLETSLSVNEVGQSSGYGDPLVFQKMFKRRTGLTPGQYRASPPTDHEGAFRGSDPSPYGVE